MFCRNINNLPHVLWVDNFSKTFRKSIPKASDGTYNNCLWTGFAAFVAADSNIQMTLKKNHSGKVVPAMPSKICTPSSILQVKAGITYVHSSIRTYYDQSVVLRYDVRNIPPKIDTKRHVEMSSIIEHKNNSTHTVHPLKLFKRNIGSNEGLVAVLSDIAKTYGMIDGTCKDYVTLNVDENIYWRVLKVCYCCIVYFLNDLLCCFVYKCRCILHLQNTFDKQSFYLLQVMYDVSNCGKSFRELTPVSLAWWHSYKWTSKLLFKVFSADFFAPYYHHLFPTQAFHVDLLSLSAASTYTTYMRLAYPSFRSSLAAAIRTPALTFRQSTMLQNLQDIFECYIPVVSTCIYWVGLISMHGLSVIYRHIEYITSQNSCFGRLISLP